ncbi:MAG TPA: hypothetical protein VHD60_04845 [Candidatus Saccharimonadales bacterium]|nr:hypothetical protein [Candidatus Saccharimonadales bacterium]
MGTAYTYVVGDRLHYGNMPGTFSGIDIVMPAALPHIYLDGRVGENRKGPRHFMPKNQQLQLEGDFNKYFTVYAPRDFQVLALSILTPDVMQTLLDQGGGFDVELYDNHLRIISNQKVYNRPVQEAQLQKIAGALITELDHKLQSWTKSSQLESQNARLVSEDNPTVNALGRKYRLTTIVLSAVYLPLSALLWGIGLNDHFHPRGNAHPSIAVDFVLPFVVFPCLYVYIVVGLPRGWLNWFIHLMNWAEEHKA